MRNLYSILRVEKGASQDDIKKAYRTLAKKLHPDHNKDDESIAERFKEVSAAYSILGDAEQRKRYDRGEIDENGNERAPNFGQGFGGYRSGAGRRTHSHEDFDINEAEGIFSEFFRFTGGRGGGSRAGGQRRNPYESTGRKKGLDISYEVTVGFEEAITGGKRRLTLNNGKSVDIKVPAGIKDGQVIRLSGQGGPGVGSAPKGDALVEIRVAPHPYYRREGNDIHLELPISIDEAVLGGDIQVPTPRGKLTVRIPRNSSSGRRLRLKEKGVKTAKETGHMYVTLKIMAPEQRDLELERAIKTWSGGNGKALRDKAGLN